MIPHTQPELSGNESRYLQECVATNYVSTVGPFVGRFEEQVAAATQSQGAVATSSGTTAIHAALLALGVGHGDLVILPAFTFIASANAISHCGATPWLLDIDRNTWNLDGQLLQECLTHDTHREGDQLVHTATNRRVAAVMPVYTLGLPADMDTIVDVSRNFGLPVVADAAAALGATYKGRPLGELGADLSIISFNGNKTVTSGGGGAVIGNDLALLAEVRHLTTTARTSQDYVHDRVGYNYRMTNLDAAVGCAQMERWKALVDAKREIRRRYNDAFSNLPGIGLFPSPNNAESACWLSGIVLTPPAPSVGFLRSALRDAGIEARAFWQPLYKQQPYIDAPTTPAPATEAICSRILTLPCSTSLTEADQRAVISAVQTALTR